MIRLTFEINDYSSSAHIEGGKPVVRYKSIDFENFEIERLLDKSICSKFDSNVNLKGVEVLSDDP